MARASARPAVAPYQMAACKITDLAFIPRFAASFEITPLVPGSPSLDVKPHSPGGTRRTKEFSDLAIQWSGDLSPAKSLDHLRV